MESVHVITKITGIHLPRNLLNFLIETFWKQYPGKNLDLLVVHTLMKTSCGYRVWFWSKEIEKENIIFFWKSGLPNRLESDIIDSSEFLLSDISWDIGQTRDSSFREKHRHRCNFYWITSVGKKHRNDADVYM